ncbi:hypothetical protein ILYODFUR_034567 [Ilyodon furcidens]|uniref:Uncharacterized protein n=1 Tax=Ilyodon furcidens TaxID=33524 RepID=A0ABV0UC35_9TELE
MLSSHHQTCRLVLVQSLRHLVPLVRMVLCFSVGPFAFRERSELLGVDVPQLIQLPLASSVQILDMHHIRLLDAGVLPELVSDSGNEARFLFPSSQELPIQSQDLLLQLTVPGHNKELDLALPMEKDPIKEQLQTSCHQDQIFLSFSSSEEQT